MARGGIVGLNPIGGWIALVLLVTLPRDNRAPCCLVQVVVVAVHQGHAHARVGHVKVGVSISCDDHVISWADGPSRTVACLIPNDGVGIKVKGFGGTCGHLPPRQVHAHGTAVVEFKPFATGVGCIVVPVGVWNNFVDADISRTGG